MEDFGHATRTRLGKFLNLWYYTHYRTARGTFERKPYIVFYTVIFGRKYELITVRL